MTTKEFLQNLHSLHQEVNSFVATCNEQQLNTPRANGKWSRAEELGHLINALEQSNKLLQFPKFFIKYKFGTNNRTERTYDQVVTKYLDKLALIAIPNNPFQIKEVAQISKEKLLLKYVKQQQKFQKRLSQFSEKELSTLLLPHPLLGKLTIREFGYFTQYHTEHHFKHIQKS